MLLSCCPISLLESMGVDLRFRNNPVKIPFLPRYFVLHVDKSRSVLLSFNSPRAFS